MLLYVRPPGVHTLSRMKLVNVEKTPKAEREGSPRVRITGEEIPLLGRDAERPDRGVRDASFL